MLEMTDSTQRALGELNGKMDMLIGIVQADHADSRETAKRLERIELKQEAAARDRMDMARRMDAVTARVDGISKWGERGKGAVTVVAAAAAAIGGAVAAAWGQISRLFS